MVSTDPYQVLNITNREIPDEDIERAYKQALGLSTGNSNAAYSLLDASTLADLENEVRDAYQKIILERKTQKMAGTSAPYSSNMTKVEIDDEETSPNPKHSLPIIANGEGLKSIRLEKDILIETLVQSTKIPKKYLLAIESENFDLLPATVYIRGFIKDYCRHLGISPEPFLEYYNSKLDDEAR